MAEKQTSVSRMSFKLFLTTLLLLCFQQQQSSGQEQDIDKLEWWKKTNFYHIYIRSFRDSDGNGEGDLRGIIEKLDYLKEIDVGTLLLSPFYSSPMKDIGYDIDDYTGVNKKFGTMKDFDDLVEGLKKRNMYLVVDFVPNHSSNLHPWFQCSERALIEPEICGQYKDYYIWSSSTRFNNSYPSNWISVFGGGPAWQWSPIRKQFYLHQFLPEQPDLNLENPLVREEFKEIVRFWFRKGADGIRVDSVMFMLEHTDGYPDEPENPNYRVGQDPYERLLHTHTFGLPESASIVRDWHNVASEPEFARDNKIIITEAYGPIPDILVYYGPRPDYTFAELPFNFELLKGLNEANFEPTSVKNLVSNWMAEIQKLNWPHVNGAIMPWTCWVTGNHDNKRIINRVGLKNSETFRLIIYLAPGVPVNYYGDEIALHDSNFNAIPQRTIDEGEPTRLVFRAPMAWTDADPVGGFSTNASTWMPMNPEFKKNNVEQLLQSKEPRNHLKNYIELQRIRKKHAQLFAFGDLIFFNSRSANSKILAMGRIHKKFGHLILLANLDSEQKELVHLVASETQFDRTIEEPPTQARVLLLNKVANSTDLVEGETVHLQGLALEPNQAVLLAY